MAPLDKILGIDYGTKRIGLAVSDDSKKLAFPKKIILNDAHTFETLEEILKKERVTSIVVGESVDFSGKLNALSARIEIFIGELEDRFQVPVYKEKEFLTSAEARRSKFSKGILSRAQSHSRLKQKKSGRVDASAAALILQRYLDKRNK